MRASQFINEIGRLPGNSYTGGDSSLERSEVNEPLLTLPGGSRFKYCIEDRGTYKVALIIDPELGSTSVIAKLSFYPVSIHPMRNVYQVSTITVSERYRGQGLAIALYGILIKLNHITLLAGTGQTPGGRSNWLNIASIPGCEVTGYLVVSDRQIKTTGKSYESAAASALIDKIMMLGCDYLGEYQGMDPGYVFSFPVTTNGTELVNAVRNSGIEVYGQLVQRPGTVTTGLMARWVG